MPSVTETKQNDNIYDGEIAISGISGLFPSSKNVNLFEENLFNGVDMTAKNSNRWKYTDADVPTHLGMIDDCNNFDSTFFGVHFMQAEYMDAQTRLLLEQSFKAIVDAGVNPFSLRGSNSGVYVGACESMSEVTSQNRLSGFGIVGVSRSMFSNRLSFYFGLNGPSIAADVSDASSLVMLDMAVRAIRRGEIDSALVAASTTSFLPVILQHLCNMGIVCSGAQCGPFDEKSCGNVRSEGIVVMFLQKKVEAKRIYAIVVETASRNSGMKFQDESFPCGKTQQNLLNDFYNKNNIIDVNNLGYFEANGANTITGDYIECKAIDRTICKRRNEPLLIGSVKSSCGHADAASGLVAIVKVLLAMRRNTIPAQINIECVRQDIPAFKEGRLKIVRKPSTLRKPYIAINSIGYSGAQSHVLLKQFDKNKPEFEDRCDLPRLTLWCGRTEENVHSFFEKLSDKQRNDEFIALVHNAQKGGVSGMVFRGYGVLDVNDTDDVKSTLLSKDVKHNSGIKKPVVWVFSGMGSQWTGMGKSLMQLPIFKKSVQKCHNTLLPFDINIIEIITSDDTDTFKNILNCFVGIAAIQIGLVDVVKATGVTPDFIIGHSVGELGCAYADGCFTAEQMILAAYYRGKVSFDTDKIKGSMAAIGLSYNNIKSMLPEAIDVACHNSSESCTISGPCDDITKFVAALKIQNIFAKEVPCSNIAYHSRYIAHFGPMLLRFLQEIIPKPLARTSKWISTSVPKNQWFIEKNSYSSPEYHTYNLLNSVLFEESIAYLPKNSITIEFAPHSLLQSILKSALPNGVHIGLTKRNSSNNTLNFLNALGSLFINGVEISVDELYPKVVWPVCRSTDSISPLIDFDHNSKFYTFEHLDDQAKNGMCTFSLDLNEDEMYLKGHVIDEQMLVPPSLYLECVWKTFAKMKAEDNMYDNLAVEFENVNFVRPTALFKNYVLKLSVVIQRSSGKFEISQNQSLVAFGVVRDIIGKIQPTPLEIENTKIKNIGIMLSKETFYKELALRGYYYSDDFKTVETSNKEGSYGKIKWQQNWVTFLDSMFQIQILGYNSRELLLPTRLRTLRIYPHYHRLSLEIDPMAEIVTNNLQKRSICAGIEMIEVSTHVVPRRQELSKVQLSKFQFLPHFPSPKLTEEDVVRCSLQIILENLPEAILSILQLEYENSRLMQMLVIASREYKNIQCNFTIYHKSHSKIKHEHIVGVEHVFKTLNSLMSNLLVLSCNQMAEFFPDLNSHLMEPGFLILQLKTKLDNLRIPQGLSLLAVFPTEHDTYLLLQKSTQLNIFDKSAVLEISNEKSDWLPKVQNLCISNREVLLVADKSKYINLLDLVKHIKVKATTGGCAIKCVFIEDESAPAFDINLPLYQTQLRLGLSINVYKKGHWGTYRHLLLGQKACFPIKYINPVHANLQKICDLNTLHWQDTPLNSSECEVRVVYSAVNGMDLLLAFGLENQISSNAVDAKTFGIEYSGFDLKTKKRIMGMVAKSALGSHIKEKYHLTWEIPAHWSLKDAATIPVAYSTVYYAFFHEVDIRCGKSVLIHNGCSDIGLAAIQVALAYGLEVYTTVNSTEHIRVLQSLFPKLTDENIASCCDTSFEEVILSGTKGKGVNFVLNQQTGDIFKASLRCLSSRGHFLEIGKIEISNNKEMGLGVFLRELSFHAVIVENLFSSNNMDIINILKRHIQDDINNGVVIPLPCTVFPADQLEKAFRSVIDAGHVGKILVQMRENDNSEAVLPIKVQKKVYFSSNYIYIVTGYFDEVAFELVDWMIVRGARKILLNISKCTMDDFEELRMRIMEERTSHFAVNKSDTATHEGCLELMTAANKLGEIGGVFHLAFDFNEMQDRQDFIDQIKTTQGLDEISRMMCKNLPFFTVLTNVSFAKGIITNFNIGNATIEHIINKRVADGFSGKSIQWNITDNGARTVANIPFYINSLDALLSCTEECIVSAFVVNKTVRLIPKSPLEVIAKELELKNAHSLSLNMTVGKMEMNPVKLLGVKYALEKEFNIYLSPVDLQNMSLDNLIQLCDENKNIKTDFIEVERVDKTILQSLCLIEKQPLPLSNELIPLNNVAHGVPVIVFSGISGQTTKVWQRIGNSLNNPAFMYQYDSDENIQTIHDAVISAFEKIGEFLNKKGMKTFNIIAYSLGAALAHDTIIMLEKLGCKGKVIFIDSSKLHAMEIMHGLAKIYTSSQLSKNMLEIIMHELVPDVTVQAIELYMKFKYTNQIMNQAARDFLQENNCKNANALVLFIESVLVRLQILYDLPKSMSFEPIQSDVLLIKASQVLLPDMDEFYGLEALTTRKVDWKMLDGDHKTILQNETLLNIVNIYFK